jgi:hypothetical protein
MSEEAITERRACLVLPSPTLRQRFCDPRLDRSPGEPQHYRRRTRALPVLWARIDREFVDRAPVLGLIADQVSLR